MEENNKFIISVIFISLVFIISLTSIKLFNNNTKVTDKNLNEEITYDLVFKVNPLVTFTFSINDDKAIIKSFNLSNDEAIRIFKDIDFIGLDINEAIDLYGDKLEENEILFTIINVWTTWDKKDYIKSTKYNLSINTVDNNFIKNIKSNTDNALVYNKKYYSFNKKSKYDYIIFNDNGNMEYSVDNEVLKTELENNYYYTILDSKLKITSKDDNYFDNIGSYDECEILYNRLKCDYYEFIDNNFQLVSTEYFEARN